VILFGFLLFNIFFSISALPPKGTPMPKHQDKPYTVNVIRQPDKNVQRAFFAKLTQMLVEDEEREKQKAKKQTRNKRLEPLEQEAA
jgi:hypothetical protein